MCAFIQFPSYLIISVSPHFKCFVQVHAAITVVSVTQFICYTCHSSLFPLPSSSLTVFSTYSIVCFFSRVYFRSRLTTSNSLTHTMFLSVFHTNNFSSFFVCLTPFFTPRFRNSNCFAPNLHCYYVLRWWFLCLSALYYCECHVDNIFSCFCSPYLSPFFLFYPPSPDLSLCFSTQLFPAFYH